MGSLGLQEILVVAVVALIVFGPERLPELARNAGKAIARFRTETQRSVDELKRAADLEDLERELHSLKRDLTDVRGSVTRTVRTELDRAESVAAEVRGADAPPPVDPDAT